MDIERITHKGLRRFFETGNAKGLVGDVARIRKMLAFIDAAGSFDELAVPPITGCTSWLATGPGAGVRRRNGLRR